MRPVNKELGFHYCDRPSCFNIVVRTQGEEMYCGADPTCCQLKRSVPEEERRTSIRPIYTNVAGHARTSRNGNTYQVYGHSRDTGRTRSVSETYAHHRSYVPKKNEQPPTGFTRLQLERFVLQHAKERLPNPNPALAAIDVWSDETLAKCANHLSANAEESRWYHSEPAWKRFHKPQQVFGNFPQQQENLNLNRSRPY
eukprot:g14974.t1